MRYVEQRLLELGADGNASESISIATRGEKVCSRCKIAKPLEEYSESKAGALGRQARCRVCINLIGKAYQRRIREAKSARPRPDRCECCEMIANSRRALHWDHDHKLGGFRGWLCQQCNLALGCVDDRIDRLEQLIAYLRRGGGPA